MHYIKRFENCKYDQLFKTWKIITELKYASKPKENDSFTSLNINNQEIDDPYTISEQSMATDCDKLTANKLTANQMRRLAEKSDHKHISLSPQPSCSTPHFKTKSL